MGATHVALLRGINVGKNKRVAMADLRAVFEGLGCTDVRTHLNSGNVLFTASTPPTSADAAAAVADATGVHAALVVLPVRRLAAIVKGNPLGHVATDDSKLLVVVIEGLRPSALPLPAGVAFDADRLVAGRFALYEWCPNGIDKSLLQAPFWNRIEGTATGRNIRTLRTLHELAS